MYGRRVPKSHPRIEACGAVDELNAALGLARATSTHDFVSENLLPIQKDLVVLMGELATEIEDLPRYAKDGYALLNPEATAKLEKLIREIEAQNVSFKGLGHTGSDVVFGCAGFGAHNLSSCGTPGLRIERSQSTQEPGDSGLFESAGRPALALCALGGSAGRFSKEIRACRFKLHADEFSPAGSNCPALSPPLQSEGGQSQASKCPRGGFRHRVH